jgi:hypothetical protein
MFHIPLLLLQSNILSYNYEQKKKNKGSETKFTAKIPAAGAAARRSKNHAPSLAGGSSALIIMDS